MVKKIAASFFLVMLVLTWVSWKLDELRVPEVVCTSPTVSAKGYILPLAAVEGQDDHCFVYQLEETGSYFSPLVARRVSVFERSRDNQNVTVSGLSGWDVEIVLYTSRTLTGDSVAVKRWANGGFSGRVEVTCEEGKAALQSVFDQIKVMPFLENLNITWESDRLVLTGADRFTARRLQTVLIESGLSEETLTVRDYAWADETLTQGKNFWQLAGIFSFICILVRCGLAMLKVEYRCGSEALQIYYLADYLRENSVRLLAKIIFLTLGVFVGFAALKWLWEIHLTLPTGFLPDKSIFDLEHYRLWLENAFPADGMSDYGRELSRKLKEMCLWGLIESVLLLAAGFIPIKHKVKKRKDMIRNEK